MTKKTEEPIFGAAILKLSFILNRMIDQPGFRVVYFATLKELGLTDHQVTVYINEHRTELEAHIKKGQDKTS
jgi:glycogen synthase